MNVLLLEDEKSIRDFVRINLQRQGYTVLEAETGEEALEMAKNVPPIDIAILDVMLPGINGFEVCGILRKAYPRLGIIMLTAKGLETDKVLGLEKGADDYVVKPFSPAELVARVKALYRRMNPERQTEQANAIYVHPFTVMLDQRKMLKGEQEIELTPKEFAIVKLLMEHLNKAVSRDDLLNKIWGKHYIGDLKIVDVNIRRLRQKVEDNPSHPRFIETVWGYGYKWRKE